MTEFAGFNRCTPLAPTPDSFNAAHGHACHEWAYNALDCAERRMIEAHNAEDWDRYDSERTGVVRLGRLVDTLRWGRC